MTNIKTWKKFATKVRSRGCHLLMRLDDFPGSILVTGCQRSGTTALARLITSSEGMVSYWQGKDDELDAALILSGEVIHEPKGRYCFQTTYVNECYLEYLNYTKSHRMIWVTRNPHSVVYSMLNNWGRFAFNELFRSCGARYLTGKDSVRYQKYGRFSIPRVRRACLSYIGKTNQLFELKTSHWKDRLIVIDYDELVLNKGLILPELYKFVELSYKQKYGDKLNAGNIDKAKQLKQHEWSIIKELCSPIYDKAKKLALKY